MASLLPQIDHMNYRFTREYMDRCTRHWRDIRGVEIVKFAVAALVLDTSDNILVCRHSPREGESVNNATGAVTETLRYLESSHDVTETALEGLARCLKEEHDIPIENIDDAELSFAGPGSYFLGEWPVGIIDGVKSTYSSVNVVLRTTNPSIFTEKQGRVSEEINGNEFMPIHNAMNTHPKRPGYLGWLQSMDEYMSEFDMRNSQPIEWPNSYIPTGEDARAPFN
ncbi:hypothetical protein KC950_04685 [Candidatus Saccharibacteria bacterium]|nr:hypothetical protein [Candidatus Saccharibacteria bacterium]